MYAARREEDVLVLQRKRKATLQPVRWQRNAVRAESFVHFHHRRSDADGSSVLELPWDWNGTVRTLPRNWTETIKSLKRDANLASRFVYLVCIILRKKVK